jgi:hypothetical protein
MTKAEQGPWMHRLDHLNVDHWVLPFDMAQGGESFDVAQDPEVLEGLVEPFRVSCLGFRAYLCFLLDCSWICERVRSRFIAQSLS